MPRVSSAGWVWWRKSSRIALEGSVAESYANSTPARSDSAKLFAKQRTHDSKSALGKRTSLTQESFHQQARPEVRLNSEAELPTFGRDAFSACRRAFNLVSAFQVAPRPLVFISAVSRELKSARQLVANTLIFLGYEPVWQDIFGTESGDLRGMLRQQIDEWLLSVNRKILVQHGTPA